MGVIPHVAGPAPARHGSLTHATLLSVGLLKNTNKLRTFSHFICLWTPPNQHTQCKAYTDRIKSKVLSMADRGLLSAYHQFCIISSYPPINNTGPLRASEISHAFSGPFTSATSIPSAWRFPPFLLCSIPAWPSKLTSFRRLSSANPLCFQFPLNSATPHRRYLPFDSTTGYGLTSAASASATQRACHKRLPNWSPRLPVPWFLKVVGVVFPYASATPRKSTL